MSEIPSCPSLLSQTQGSRTQLLPSDSGVLTPALLPSGPEVLTPASLSESGVQDPTSSYKPRSIPAQPPPSDLDWSGPLSFFLRPRGPGFSHSPSDTKIQTSALLPQTHMSKPQPSSLRHKSPDLSPPSSDTRVQTSALLSEKLGSVLSFFPLTWGTRPIIAPGAWILTPSPPVA